MTSTRLPKTITAGTLLATPIPPVKWIIPGLLPAGLAIFAGPSKAGKSWLTLWLCLQISQGKSVWGREIEPRTVLYFSLEDTLGRLQERLYQLVDAEEDPERLILQTESNGIGQGLEEQIVSFIHTYPDVSLIVIDLHEAETLKNTSVLRFHANLHKALKYAVRIDLIPSNPVDKVDHPKPQAFMASYYSAEEMEKLFEAAQGHKLELIIQLAAFYGLRRAEVMGLRWEAIDFEAKTLTIRHIVTSTRIDGKKILVEADRAKTKSSLRTLPLVDPIAERLKAVKEQQEYNQKICGNCYNQEYLGYVFVDAMGNLFQPDSVTTGFPQLLKENGLRRIRFHDLRHSCASLLLKEGVPMKQIQEWLGHSDISTTANIYAHLDSQSKNLSARTMANTLTLPEAQPIKKW